MTSRLAWVFPFALLPLLAGCAGAAAECPQAPSTPSAPVAAAKPADAKPSAAAMAALVRDVRAANAAALALNTALTAGIEQMAKRAYPVELVERLRQGGIGFDATRFDGNEVARLPGPVIRDLFEYTMKAQDLDRKRESLASLLSVAKPPIEKAWREEQSPMVGFSVVLRSEGKQGVIAELVSNREPFALGGPWPATYPVLVLEGKRAVDKSGKRWVKGAIEGKEPAVVPVAPATVAPFTSDVIVLRLGKALSELRRDIEGSKGDPEGERAGLIEQGERLVSALEAAAR